MNKSVLTPIMLLLSGWLFVVFSVQAQKVEVEWPQYGVNADNIAVIVKRGDLLSVQTAEYYQQKRRIPVEHIFTVDLPDQPVMGAQAFKQMYAQLQKQLPGHIQAMVLTWQKPYRIGCMSVTSAFTFGFDAKYCQTYGKGCQPTANSALYNTSHVEPWQALGVRPSMLLTGRNMTDIKQLIDRGVLADGRLPKGTAYLVKTQDKLRNSRAGIFSQLAQRWGNEEEIDIKFLDLSQKGQPDFLRQKQDIMLYQTGGAKIPFIKDNHFLPGAVADHLTSVGGAGLSEKGQMKAFRWLEAGATGSYGAVIEPCNFAAKFPNPSVLLPHYIRGNTLIEAYWKSVKQPGEGLFVGEPLARPYGLHKVFSTAQTVLVKTRLLSPLRPYRVEAWNPSTNRYEKIKAKQGIQDNGLTLVLKFANTPTQRFRVVDVLQQALSDS